jgi:PAS domain S-box-containing protein
MSKTLRVLFVEDSEDDVMLLTRELSRAGYELVQERVEDRAGMKAALENKDWDIIISDYNMPRFSGLAALRLLRETALDIPLIIISGTVGEDVAVETVKLGSHDYIMKNNLIRLVPAVERELREAEVRRERRMAEEALRESEERYRELAGSIGDVFFAMDRELRFTYWNRASEELTGVPSQEALGRKLYDIFPDVAGTYVDEVYSEVLSTGKPSTFINTYAMQGQDYFFEISAYPTRSGISVFARDITARRRSEERLVAINRCLLNLGADPFGNVEKILESGLDILDGVLIKYWSLEGGYYSDSYVKSRIEGYGHVGKKIERAVFERFFLWARGPFETGDEGGESIEKFDPDISEYGLGSLLGYPVMYKGEIGGCLCLYDGRERLFTQEEMDLCGMLALSISNEEERWADEQGLRDFIDIASHELRHPITVMKGYAVTLKDMEGRLDDQTRQEMLEAIDQGADRLNTLLIELLDTSRIERGRFTLARAEIDLKTLINASLLDIESIRKDNTFQVRLDENLDSLMVDSKKTCQLLTAILDNAIKFSPPGSEIVIDAERTGGEVLISILDEGEGIPDEARGRVFDRFYQVGESRYHSIPGIGLGLYISRQIVEAHGGRIWHEHRDGGGSVFRFTLPLA